MSSVSPLKSKARARNPDGSPNLIDLHVGSRIRQRRTLSGLTQEQLGDRVGIAFQQVQKYERGFNRVSAGRLFVFAGVLGVPVGWFFDGIDNDIAAASPAAIAAGADPVVSLPDDQETTREALQLARYFSAVPDDGSRRAVLDLTINLSGLPAEAAE